MWYYAQNQETMGPVSGEVLANSLKNRLLPPQTLVWQEGMPQWLPAVQVSEFSSLFPKIAATTPYSLPTAEELEKNFKGYWICMAVGFPLLILLIGLIPLIASCVFSMILLYQLWKLVPRSPDLPEPMEAVGFLFIPYFNLYWMFIAYRKLAFQLNHQLEAHGKSPIIDETFLLVTLILSLVPVVSFLAPFLMIKVFYQLKTAGIQLLAKETPLLETETLA